MQNLLISYKKVHNISVAPFASPWSSSGLCHELCVGGRIHPSAHSSALEAWAVNSDVGYQ